MSEAMRIQRALARAGVASRRTAEALVEAGRVTVNGAVATIGQTVTPGRDDIRVDGSAIGRPVATQWYILHKPAGVVTTRSDPNGRETVFDLVPPTPGLTYVGRLDYLTEGVLLLTTDGAAAHALAHPSGEVARTYVATVRGDAPRAVRELLRGMVRLEDGPVEVDAARALPMDDGRWGFEVTLHEGRNREVRRLCEALELRVDRLVRTAYGPITLGTLRPGEWRVPTSAEVRRLTPSARPPRRRGARH
jgi:23S rRNA pseudouridine2605 synthase